MDKKLLITADKLPKIKENKPIKLNSIVNQNPADNKIIKKKIKYNQLLRLIKKGRYISARVTAEALNINFATVLEWVKTSKAIQVASESIDSYISGIEKAGKKDWKAYDRLIQYAKGQDNNNQSNVTNQILIVNNDKKVRLASE